MVGGRENAHKSLLETVKERVYLDDVDIWLNDIQTDLKRNM
jgi:hypothetical protein